jgi:hypothetical protein
MKIKFSQQLPPKKFYNENNIQILTWKSHEQYIFTLKMEVNNFKLFHGPLAVRRLRVLEILL